MFRTLRRVAQAHTGVGTATEAKRKKKKKKKKKKQGQPGACKRTCARRSKEENALWRAAEAAEQIRSEHGPDDDFDDVCLGKLEPGDVVPAHARRAIKHLLHDGFDELRVTPTQAFGQVR